MSFSLIPHILLSSYDDLTPQMLTERGIRLLLCDLDYTLAPKYVPRPDEALRTWLADMERAGVRVMILSNNRSSARVERFCKDLGIDYVGHAGKPSVRGYRQARKRPASRRRRRPCWGTSSSPMCWAPTAAACWR